MDFTTTTEIVRKGSKIFEKYSEAIVLNNNKNIGLLLGGELARAVIESGVLNQIREELWELNDKKTIETIKKFKSGDKTNSINLKDYRKKYDI